MGLKEYWLIKEITTIPIRRTIVDKLNANGLREAERDFQTRNNFKKLKVKADLVIVRSERWYQ